MKRAVIIVVLAGMTVVMAFGIFIYASTESEFTECFGIFGSPEAGERVAGDRSREAGFDASVDRGTGETSVIFESGETGEDAREFRRNGCLERTALQ